MQMSTKYGFAFLCTPKCASVSIEEAIKKFCNINITGRPALKHIDAKVYSERVLPLHQQLVPSVKIESFCMMRDPMEWMESWYRYRSRNALDNSKHPNYKRSTKNLTYQEFIVEYLQKNKVKPIAKPKTQFNFVSLGNNKIGVDYIIPLSRMDLAAEFLSKKIGKNIAIPTKNVSPKREAELDSSVEKQLRQYLAKDILLYNFIEDNGQFNKMLHSDKIYSTLQLG